MSKRLYVGNLLRALTQQELAEAFEPWGPVETTIIVVDHLTGESRGFGFVDIPDNHAADAIAKMHGNLFRGRPLIVNEARPREAGPREVGPRDARPREGRSSSSASGGYGRSSEGFPPDERHETAPRGGSGQSPDGAPTYRDTGRDRGESSRGAPRYSEGRGTQEGRGPQEGRSGGRSKSEYDRGHRDAGKNKDRGGKRGRDVDNDDGDW